MTRFLRLNNTSIISEDVHEWLNDKNNTIKDLSLREEKLLRQISKVSDDPDGLLKFQKKVKRDIRRKKCPNQLEEQFANITLFKPSYNNII